MKNEKEIKEKIRKIELLEISSPSRQDKIKVLEWVLENH